MDALNNEALLKARSMISTTFVSPASLDELSALSIQFERQLHAAEGQLNSAVQGKLDSLKRAVDLMDESAVKLSTMSTKISKIDERIALTNTAISNYDNLSRIHNARENLQSVIAQIDFFAKVPERVNYYRQLLNSSPGKLREVYLEALKLDSLRNALMKEILVSRTRRKAAGKDKYSEESHRRMKMAVENYLSRVTDLVAEVRERVFENIDQMWELAVQSPEDLVSSIEIIEMQQEYNDRREAHAKKKATEEGVSYSRQHEDVRGKALELIQSNFEQLIATEYDKLLEEHEEVANRTKVQHALEVTNQLLQSLASIRKDVAPCMPDNYNLTAIFVSCFEQRLKPLIDDLVQDLPAMKVSDILELINWIEFYKFTMEDFGFAQRNILDDFSVLKVDLLIEYMNKIKQQVTSWFVNIKKQSLEIVQDSDGLLVTSNPEDMFNIIHAQLSVAKEKLPPEYAKEVAVACLQVLQDVQRENHDTLTNNWKSMDPETMCATVNDNQRMREKCVEFGEDLLKYVEDEQEKVMLSASLEAVSKEYHALANRIVSYLGRSILEDLDDPFFSRIYNPEWEGGEGLTATLIVTLQDYFHDLKQWLSNKYFCLLVKDVLVDVVTYYAMSLRKRVQGNFVFGSEIVAAKVIFSDKEVIEGFFEDYFEEIGIAILQDSDKESKSSFSSAGQSKLTEEMSALGSLASVIGARSANGIERDLKVLFVRWKGDGLKVAQAAFLANPSLNKTDRTNNIETAKKVFDSMGISGRLLEEFAGYDAAMTAAEKSAATKANKQGKQITGGFWGRGNKQK